MHFLSLTLKRIFTILKSEFPKNYSIIDFILNDCSDTLCLLNNGLLKKNRYWARSTIQCTTVF